MGSILKTSCGVLVAVIWGQITPKSRSLSIAAWRNTFFRYSRWSTLHGMVHVDLRPWVLFSEYSDLPMPDVSLVRREKVHL